MTVAAPTPAVTWGGRTTLQPRALRRIAEASVAELAGVAPGEVSVELTGMHGALALEVTTPLDSRAAVVSGTLVERAVGISAGLVRRLDELAGRRVGRVHVRFTRLARKDPERRVL